MWRRYDAFMSRLYGPLNSLRGKVLSGIFSLLMGVLGSYVYDELSEPKGSSLKLSAADLLRPSSLGILLLIAALTYLLLGVLRFFSQRAFRRHEARGGFDLIESASKLPPEYLGFQVTRPGEPVPLDRRPFYESVYVHRIAVPYHERAEEDPEPKYEEAQLARFLKEGRGFVLLGPPLDGKSRTLYEILKNLEDHVVVVPKVNEKVPSDEAFSLLLKDRRVVLLLDDLTRYVDAEVDLREFWEKLGRHTSHPSSRVVAATCRDGPELSAVRDAQEQSLKWFYDWIPLNLSLLEASSEEKRWLAERIGKTQEEREWAGFPELGHVVMENPMNQMRGRFERLSHQSFEQRDALRALKLLSAAGVLPFTRGRLLAVMRGVFERSPAHLGDCLDSLAEQSFLSPASHDRVEPEPAYLRYNVVTYAPGRKSEDYFADLANVLEDLEDTEGLFHLGTTYASSLGDYEDARACFDRAVRLRPHDAWVWFDKGRAMRRLGTDLLATDAEAEVDAFEESLGAFEEAIRLSPSFREAWNSKGITLRYLGRDQEAIDALDEAINLYPDFHDAWCNKGVSLTRLNRHQEALDALDEAIRIRSDCFTSWIHKADTLSVLGGLPDVEGPGWIDRSLLASEVLEEAVEAYEEATKIEPDVFWAWNHKGRALLHLERYEEASEAFDRGYHYTPGLQPFF